jgi:carboxymethylenebutenolidase
MQTKLLRTILIARFCVGFLVIAGACQRASAAEIAIHEASLPAVERVVTVKAFSAIGDARRPAIVILHGVNGVEKFRSFYERTAAALARAGIDAYVLSYYDEADVERAGTIEGRHAIFSERVDVWSRLVGDVVGDILSDGRSSGRIGLVGFSQGGFLGTAIASRDRRISALAVFYGGLPTASHGRGDQITRLPPLLELHGDADTTVPMSRGRELVDLARKLGQPADIVIYPGAGHGFDGAADADAERRVVAFFQQQLSSPGNR